MYDGQFNFELDSVAAVAAIPASDYSVFLKSIPADDKPSISSYAPNISIRDTPAGKSISLPNTSKN
jgi:hypothetical protein